jgi:hypothetical protein
MRYIEEALPLHQLYADRHRVQLIKVLNIPMLELAATLEFEVSQRRMYLAEARRLFIQQYPQTNCVTSIKTTIDRAGRKEKVRVPSVLNLIRPFKDTRYRIKNLSEL